MDGFDDVLQPVEVEEERDSYESALDQEYVEEVEAFYAEREAVEDTIEHVEAMYDRWRAKAPSQETVKEAYEAAQHAVQEHMCLTMESEGEAVELPENPEALYFFTYDTQLDPLDGLFLSAAAEVVEEPITLTDVADVAFLGYRNTDTIEVEGDAGSCLGYANQGTITVEGDAGPFTAADMEDGEVAVGGSVGDYLAQNLTGGAVRVKGDAGFVAAQRLTGGTVTIDGDAGRYVAQDADIAVGRPDGRVTVRGEADVSARAPDRLVTAERTAERGRLRGLIDRGWERVDSYLDADRGVVERNKDRIVTYLSDPDTGSFRSGLLYGTLWWTQVPAMVYDIAAGIYDRQRGNPERSAMSLQSKYDADLDSRLETVLWGGGLVAGFTVAAAVDKGVKVALGTQMPEMSVNWFTDLDWFGNNTVIVAGLAADGVNSVERGMHRVAGRVDEGYAQPSSPEALYARLHAET